jgi:hypothetical protein
VAETSRSPPDPVEIQATRSVRLDDAADWAPQSPTPHQAYRFAIKLAAALNDGASA